MKKVFASMIAGMAMMAGASAFAHDGGADGGSRMVAMTTAHTQAAMVAYEAKKATAQVASAQK